MSIGLLVDFILHILIRYYEVSGTREEKVARLLGSMGSSILVGGTTTFLGTVPLAFSTSHIFTTFFVSFVAIVTLGMGHGLILLPIVLGLVGPQEELVVATLTPPIYLGECMGRRLSATAKAGGQLELSCTERKYCRELSA